MDDGRKSRGLWRGGLPARRVGLKIPALYRMLGFLPYRVRQFALAALAPVAPAEVAAALRQAALPAPAARLFRTMPRAYQRHALNVAARLQEEGAAGPTLLQAALLHDMGKWDPATGARVGVVTRSIATLLGRV